MTWTDIKSLLNDAMANYTAKRAKLLRRGKYSGGDHWNDGTVAMLYETIQEMNQTDEYDPIDKAGVRRLIYAFNRLTGEKVPDVWSE